jgi:hypothetical protein
VAFADPPWHIRRENILLAFGMFALFLAMVYTYTGKAWTRFHGWVYRAKEPKQYWIEVATYYLGGVGLIVLYLYEVQAFSR